MNLQLSQEDVEIVYELVESLIGADKSDSSCYGVFVENIVARMQHLGIAQFGDYLSFVRTHNEEFDQLIHSLTVHTTQWFCEQGQFAYLAELVRKRIMAGQFRGVKMRLWSAACASGQEAYSAALVLETLRAEFPDFDYEILASDIDPVSVSVGREGFYDDAERGMIPAVYHRYLVAGSGERAGSFTLCSDILTRVSFKTHSLLNRALVQQGHDVVLCRHVLGDFVAEKVRRVVKMLSASLRPDGLLVLGPDERMFDHDVPFEVLGQSYYKISTSGVSLDGRDLRRYVVLIVDDEGDFRELAIDILSSSNLVCYGVGSIPHALAELAVRSIDIVLCDISMPGINGFEGVSQLRGYGFAGPIVILSTYDRELIVENFSRLGTQAEEYIEKQRFVKEPDRIAELIHAIARKRSRDSTISKTG